LAVSTDSERRQLLRALDALLDAAAETQTALGEVEERIRRTRDLASEGVSIRVFLESFTDPGGTSTDLTARMAALEAARRRTRQQIVVMGRAEGLSLAQLAEFWGVSRQLISRYANDALDEADPAPS
jgi:hypothetical protein